MAFSEVLKSAVISCATKRKIEPAALLAVVEVECAGHPFEADGRTPRFLFERHIFHKELKVRAPDKLDRAVAQGLAIPKWSRTTQYKDQGSAAGRKRVLDAARVIDAECANRSCSWGIGQIMGFHAADLGYGTATAMVAAITRGGLPEQVDCLLTFLDSKNLIAKLNAKDWAGFARAYNGPAYAQNDYDTRLAEAYARWVARLQGEKPDDAEQVPLGRTPVQNAESSNPLASPEVITGAVTAGTGVVTAAKGGEKGPIDYALAVVIVLGFCLGAFFIFKRMRRTPT